MTLKNIRKRIKLIETTEEPVIPLINEVFKYATGIELSIDVIKGYLWHLKTKEKELTPIDPTQIEIFK